MNATTNASSTARIGSPSMRKTRLALELAVPTRLPFVQRDHSLGQLRQSDFALREFPDHLAAIEDHQSICDFVHVREVVLDIDAGVPRRLYALDEGEHLAHLADGQCGGGLI